MTVFDAGARRPARARRRRRSVVAVLVVFAVAVTAGACGDDGSTTDTGAGGTGDTAGTSSTTPGTGDGAGSEGLAGRAFVGTDVTVDGEPYELAADTKLRLSFNDGELGADAGCNSMGGTFVVTDDVLVVDSLSQTEMACVPEARMEQDTWLVGILTGGPTVLVDGDRLVLTAGTTVITLTDEEVADPDRPLVGTAWELDTVLSGDTASSDASTASAEALVLTLVYEGTYTVSGSCGIAPTGTFALGTDRDVVTFTADPADLCAREMTTSEAALNQVLAAEQATYEIDRDRLTLLAGGKGVSLRAQP